MLKLSKKRNAKISKHNAKISKKRLKSKRTLEGGTLEQLPSELLGAATAFTSGHNANNAALAVNNPDIVSIRNGLIIHEKVQYLNTKIDEWNKGDKWSFPFSPEGWDGIILFLKMNTVTDEKMELFYGVIEKWIDSIQNVGDVLLAESNTGARSQALKQLESLPCKYVMMYWDELKKLYINNRLWNKLKEYCNGIFFDPLNSKPMQFTNDDIKTSVNNYIEKTNDGFKYGPISFWDTSQVTDMRLLFLNKENFNEPLDWKMDGVTNCGEMFHLAVKFNNGGEPGTSDYPLRWNMKNVNDMHKMFFSAISFNQELVGFDEETLQGSAPWDTRSVTDMSDMFANAKKFNNGGKPGTSNKPLELNTDNVTNMTGVFRNAKSFNQSINSWNTDNVRVMKEMFDGATLFNNGGEPVKLRTNNVQDMSYMFLGAEAFNQELVSTAESFVLEGGERKSKPDLKYYWNTGNVVTMRGIFRGAKNFNNGGKHDTSNKPLILDTSDVYDMSEMFMGAESFNQQLLDAFAMPGGHSFIVQSVKYMDNMFNGAKKFNNGGEAGTSNNPLKWNTKNLKWMENMFMDAKSFNQELLGFGDGTLQESVSWDTRSVERLNGTFRNAIKFNNGGKPLKFNTMYVRTMKAMFSGAQSFNQELYQWSTSSVVDMSEMFMGAIEFNNGGKPLDWDMKQVRYMDKMFERAEKFNNGDEPNASNNPLQLYDNNKLSMFTGANSFNQNISFMTQSYTAASIARNVLTSPLQTLGTFAHGLANRVTGATGATGGKLKIHRKTKKKYNKEIITRKRRL